MPDGIISVTSGRPKVISVAHFCKTLVPKFNVYSVQMNPQRMRIWQKRRSEQFREKKNRRNEQKMPVFCQIHLIILNIRICSIV
jgi:hypothetical protein